MIRFVLTIFACLFLYSTCHPDYPNANKLANKIFYKTLKTQLIPFNHYELIGYGGHSTRDILVLVSTHFWYYGARNQEQMEDMLINTVETVLEAYNSNKEIRPLLVDYPMTKKHFHIILGTQIVPANSFDNIDTLLMGRNSPWRIRYDSFDPLTGKPVIKQGDPYDVVKARRAAAHANASADLSTTSIGSSLASLGVTTGF